MKAAKRPIVKICGLTRLEDARLALELGADELGFVLAPSPRRISPASAAALVSELRSEGKKFRAIGVFVNESPNAMREIMEAVGLDAAQVHGDEGPGDCLPFAFPWYRALRPATAEEARRLASAGWACPRLLAEAAQRGAYGGTGTRLSLEVALAARDATEALGKEFFLAGGLGPGNVAEAVRAIGPAGLDLSSGVEEAPGIKSGAALRAFFEALRGAVAAPGAREGEHGAP